MNSFFRIVLLTALCSTPVLIKSHEYTTSLPQETALAAWQEDFDKPSIITVKKDTPFTISFSLTVTPTNYQKWELTLNKTIEATYIATIKEGLIKPSVHALGSAGKQYWVLQASHTGTITLMFTRTMQEAEQIKVVTLNVID